MCYAEHAKVMLNRNQRLESHSVIHAQCLVILHIGGRMVMMMIIIMTTTTTTTIMFISD